MKNKSRISEEPRKRDARLSNGEKPHKKLKDRPTRAKKSIHNVKRGRPSHGIHPNYRRTITQIHKNAKLWKIYGVLKKPLELHRDDPIRDWYQGEPVLHALIKFRHGQYALMPTEWVFYKDPVAMLKFYRSKIYFMNEEEVRTGYLKQFVKDEPENDYGAEAARDGSGDLEFLDPVLDRSRLTQGPTEQTEEITQVELEKFKKMTIEKHMTQEIDNISTEEKMPVPSTQKLTPTKDREFAYHPSYQKPLNQYSSA